MTAPVLAWSDAAIYELPEGQHLWGWEFELLPAGTMFAAAAILHGLIGMAAEPMGDEHYQVRDETQLIIYGLGDTETAEIELYWDDVLAAFERKQLSSGIQQ